jgi:hypothetical protein
VSSPLMTSAAISSSLSNLIYFTSYRHFYSLALTALINYVF